MKRSSLCAGLAAVLLGALVHAAAGMQPNCRKFVKNYVLEHCTGFRDKRSLTSRELELPPGGLESDVKESRVKRQAVTLSEIIMTSRVPVYHYRYLHVPGFIGTVFVPVMPATHTDGYGMGPKHDVLPQEKNSNLGFKVNINELEELFEELSDRLPRSPNHSINEVHEEFMKSAFACCSNNDMCKSMDSLISCP